MICFRTWDHRTVFAPVRTVRCSNCSHVSNSSHCSPVALFVIRAVRTVHSVRCSHCSLYFRKKLLSAVRTIRTEQFEHVCSQFGGLCSEPDLEMQSVLSKKLLLFFSRMTIHLCNTLCNTPLCSTSIANIFPYHVKFLSRVQSSIICFMSLFDSCHSFDEIIVR